MKMGQSEKQQMVEIDGGRIRRLREERGLTQLYVATVVGVTTDTVSRWENGRYPAMRRENAEKLAQVLEVDLAGIRASSGPAARPRRKGFGRGTWIALALFGLFLILAFAAGRFFLPADGDGIRVERLLPPLGAPGSVVPVVLRISGPGRGSFILDEALPPGAELVAADPVPVERGRRLRWLARFSGQPLQFAWTVRLPRQGREVRFRGVVRLKARWLPVAGAKILPLAPFHWADANRDMKIDDDEILAVYETFAEQPFLVPLRDGVDDLWAADRYRATAAGFVPAPARMESTPK